MNSCLDTTVVYSAVLRPHRSASQKAVRWVVLLLLVPFSTVAVGFVAAGAWPILPFFGFEVVLVYVALRWNQRAGNALEAINLTPAALTVRRVDHWGNQSDFVFPPSWLQVNLVDIPGRDSRLELRSHGRSLIIASFLLPDERRELAQTLRRELHRLTAAHQTLALASA